MGFAQLPSSRVLALPADRARHIRHAQLVSRSGASARSNSSTRQPLCRTLVDSPDSAVRFDRRPAHLPATRTTTRQLAHINSFSNAISACVSHLVQRRRHSPYGHIRRRPYLPGHPQPASSRGPPVPCPCRCLSASQSTAGSNFQSLRLGRLSNLETLPLYPGLHRWPRRPLRRATLPRFRRRVSTQGPVAANLRALAHPHRYHPSRVRLGHRSTKRSRLDYLLPGPSSHHSYDVIIDAGLRPFPTPNSTAQPRSMTPAEGSRTGYFRDAINCIPWVLLGVLWFIFWTILR